MIKHILKLIWTERRINLWIQIELILVFCILWFCSDYIYFITKRIIEPEGFDIEHVYKIEIGSKRESVTEILSGGDEARDTMVNDFWTLYDRVKQYPAVEYASVSLISTPYSGGFSINTYYVDTVPAGMMIKTVTPEFFDVFKINIEKGKVFESGDNRVTIISGDADNKLFEKSVYQLDTIFEGDGKTVTGNSFKVVGVANKSKRSEFDDYFKMIYFPLAKNSRDVLRGFGVEICVRVKPEADKSFIESFTRDMEAQLSIEPFYLNSVLSMSKARDNYLGWVGYENNLKSIFSILAFLVINIFLAVVGTFWFRIRSRTSEIGLRIAMGATRMNVKNMFITETIILLFIASLIATILCVNISMTEMLESMGMPKGGNETDILQHIINYGFTFLFLTIIIVAAVWYPAKKASDIEPAIALRDE